jgi:hypothetical protein
LCYVVLYAQMFLLRCSNHGTQSNVGPTGLRSDLVKMF